MTRTRTALTALSCLSVLALGACSDDDPEPKFGPAPSSSAPTEPTSSPTETGATSPTVPSDARAADRQSAERFIDYWFAALSYAMTSGDASAVRASSEPGCKSCIELVAQIEDLYGKGGHVKTDGWTVGASVVQGDFDGKAPLFLLRIDETQRTLYDGEKLIDRTAPTRVPMRIELSHSGDNWAVRRLEILQ